MGQQHRVVHLKTLYGLGIFGTVDAEKIVKVALCYVLFGGLLYLMQFGFGFCLSAP
jgi:hypothetical protein